MVRVCSTFWRKRFFCILVWLALHAAMAPAAEVKTGDGLVCNMDANGRIARLSVGTAELSKKPNAASGFVVRDYVSGGVLRADFPVQQTEGGFVQEGTFEKAQLGLSAQARATEGAIEFSGAVVDKRGAEDRAVDVIFRIPFQAKSPVWWRDIRTPATVEPAPRQERRGIGQKETPVSFPPVTTRRLRIVQPPGGGCEKAPNALWMAEVEVLGRDQTVNILREGAGIAVKTESTSKGYSPDRLTDGARNDRWDDDWFKRGWVSDSKPTDKWVEFDFPENTEIARVDIYWCLERFGYATSRTFRLERWDGEKWVHIESAAMESHGMPGDVEKAPVQTEEKDLENTAYPFACMTERDGSAGVAVAIPADSPCNFSMAYLPNEECIELTFKFGLSQLPRSAALKGSARFRFVVYRVDPEWSFRDAARRYYEMYPEAFRVRTNRNGLWLFTAGVMDCLNPQDYTFHEGGPRGSELDEIYNIYTCPYVLVGQREFDSKAKDYDEAIRALNDLDPQMRSSYGGDLKQLIEDGSLRDVNGRYIIKLRRRGGSLDGPAVVTFPVNPAPRLFEDLKRPNVAAETLDHVRRVIESDPLVDGIYVDSLSGWGGFRNSRRDHFAYTDIPLTHDDKGHVIIWNKFPHVEFLRELGRILHPRDKIVFGNGIRRGQMWCAFECDVHGVEAAPYVHKDASHYCWSRTIAWHKPFLLLYYYNYPKEDCPREAAEEYIQSAIAYGIAPEVRPFGKFIKRDLDLYDKFMPIFRLITRAGWEPVTHARASDSRIWLERFGGAENGLFFTLYNPTAAEVPVQVTIDLAKLNLPQDAGIAELVTGGKWKGGKVDLVLPPRSLRTLQAGRAPSPVSVVKMSREELVERLLSIREKAPGSNGNLLQNPGFEEADDDGRPMAWGRSVTGDAEATVVDGDAHTGKRRLYLRDSDDKGSANLVVSFPFVQPGAAYELSLWVKQTAKGEHPGRLWYQWVHGSKRLSAYRFDFPKTTEWAECRWTLVPPEGADELRITLGSSVPEKVEFSLDDVRFVRRKASSEGRTETPKQ